MSLLKLLDTNLISVESSLKRKDELLTKVAELACKSQLLSDIEVSTVLQGLREREELGTTGFGRGIAIPHCRLSGIEEFILGIIIAPNKVDFDSLDEQPVSMAIFLIAPEEQSQRHIRLLSAISQVLRIPGAIEEITAQTTPEMISESFLKYVHDDVDLTNHESKNLFHVVINNEDIFHEILPIFSALNGSTEFILDVKSTNDYMAKVPLFAGLLNDDFLSFCRVLVVTVEKRMTNEIIRRVESITGPLDNSSDVKLIVQDVVYASCNRRSCIKKVTP